MIVGFASDPLLYPKAWSGFVASVPLTCAGVQAALVFGLFAHVSVRWVRLALPFAGLCVAAL